MNAQEYPSTAAHGTVGSYIAGFIFSIILTVMAYLATVYHGQSVGLVKVEIIALGAVQLLVQLIFFLHLDRESKPRWNMAALVFAVTVVAILVGGSLWIMSHLNYSHDLSPTEIIKDEGITQ